MQSINPVALRQSCGAILAIAASLCAPAVAATSLRHSFVENAGQWQEQALFRADGANHSLWLARDHAVLEIKTDSGLKRARMRLQGANTPASIVGEGAANSYSSFFQGGDPERWRTKVGHHDKVRYRQVYPGIDLVYHASQDSLEYDFEVSPGADPGAITLVFDGAAPRLDADGNLQLTLGAERLLQRAPIAYQLVAEQRVSVSSAWRVRADRQVVFDIGDYDRSLPLIVDPIIDYSSYVGGSGTEDIANSFEDGAGNLVIYGVTASADFPTDMPLQPGTGGQTDLFITKVDLATNSVEWSTYFGGSGLEFGQTADADTAGNIAIGFGTTSTDLPLQAAAFSSPKPLGIARISADGATLLFSTYFGGTPNTGPVFNNNVRVLRIDGQGRIVVIGDLDDEDFPATATPYGNYQCLDGWTNFGARADAYLARFSPAGVLDFAHCLGGNGRTVGRGLAFDSAGNMFITGYTFATDLPLVNPLQNTLAGERDFYLAKLSPDADTIQWFTYYGGSGLEFAQRLATDSSGNVILAGSTRSLDFPTVNAAQPDLAGGEDGVLLKIAGDGSSVVFATLAGGRFDFNSFAGEQYWNVGVDADDNIYATGHSDAPDFPVRNPVQGQLAGPNPTGFAFPNPDAVAAKYTAAGELVYATYLGTPMFESQSLGSVTPAGDVYVTDSFAGGMPLVNAFQTFGGGGSDAYVARLNAGAQSDADGIPDELESSAPDGDGNGDGTPDAQQDNVVSLPGLNGDGLTIAAPTGVPLVDFALTNAPPVAPFGLDLSRGVISFELNGLVAGAATTVTVFVHTGPPPTSYWKFGPEPGDPTPHWYEFMFDGQTGAQINGNTITLRFVDGQRGDADLTANGAIVDPGGPGLPFPDTDGDGLIDPFDNCTLVANTSQVDTNFDGFGNHCDADLSNEGAIDFIDLGIMKSVFFSSDPDADLNADGSVDFIDLAMLKQVFFGAPGPAGSL